MGFSSFSRRAVVVCACEGLRVIALLEHIIQDGVSGDLIMMLGNSIFDLCINHNRHNLNCLKGISQGSIWGTTIGDINFDARSLDYGSDKED